MTPNEFLRKYARQRHEAGGAKIFVAVGDADGRTVFGFYSLAPGALAYADTPELVRRGLARHDVPGSRLARIATDKRLQGGGLGGQLLAMAARRCLRAAAEVGGVVLIIDAKNERAAARKRAQAARTQSGRTPRQGKVGECLHLTLGERRRACQRWCAIPPPVR